MPLEDMWLGDEKWIGKIKAQGLPHDFCGPKFIDQCKTTVNNLIIKGTPVSCHFGSGNLFANVIDDIDKPERWADTSKRPFYWTLKGIDGTPILTLTNNTASLNAIRSTYMWFFANTYFQPNIDQPYIIITIEELAKTADLSK